MCVCIVKNEFFLIVIGSVIVLSLLSRHNTANPKSPPFSATIQIFRPQDVDIQSGGALAPHGRTTSSFRRPLLFHRV
jgi:hypothetical protein